MDDIFYLCPIKIELSDIETAFQNIKKIKINLFKKSDTLQVKYREKIIIFTLMNINEFKDQVDNKILIEKNISKVICISHHKSYIAEVLELSKELLLTWGGWLGNDNDGFSPLFDISNLSYFNYE